MLQSQYREWPDMGIPQEKSEFLTWFTETGTGNARERKKWLVLYNRDRGESCRDHHTHVIIGHQLYDDFSTAESRMVVHCFGGVGRTGTFMMVKRCDRKGSNNVCLSRILTVSQQVHMTLQKMKRLGGRALEIEKILGRRGTRYVIRTESPKKELSSCSFSFFLLSLFLCIEPTWYKQQSKYKFCYRMLLELYEKRSGRWFRFWVFLNRKTRKREKYL